MLINLRAMIVVLAIAIPVFAIAKPICLRYMAENDFVRRRNVWIVLTLTAFTSPSFWLFTLVAIPVVAWSGYKDTNPVALYLLLMHVISPGYSLPITTGGIDQLFEINMIRILSLALLVPAAWRLMQSDNTTRIRFTSIDLLIIAYCVFQLVLFMPYESITNTMRRGFLLFIDVLVLYFVVSRVCANRRAISEAMASFCLACSILSPLAVFESLRSWLLYYEIGSHWGNLPISPFLMRGDILRAQVSAGHSIVLGFLIAIAFGFWLYLRSNVQSTPKTVAGVIWLWAGLLAAYARAPWLVAVAIFFTYLSLVPHGFTRFVMTSLVAALAAGLVLVSPIGERVVDNLPFVGTVNLDTVIYRERLATMSWALIQKNPFFGDPYFMSYLEDLRQGQGIIDLVNTYAAVSMHSGLVGLCLFVGPFLVGMLNVYQTVNRLAGSDNDSSLLGASLLACMLGTLLILATASFILGIAVMYWALTGLAVGFSQLSSLKDSAPSPQSRAPRPYFR